MKISKRYRTGMCLMVALAAIFTFSGTRTQDDTEDHKPSSIEKQEYLYVEAMAQERDEQEEKEELTSLLLQVQDGIWVASAPEWPEFSGIRFIDSEMLYLYVYGTDAYTVSSYSVSEIYEDAFTLHIDALALSAEYGPADFIVILSRGQDLQEDSTVDYSSITLSALTPLLGQDSSLQAVTFTSAGTSL